MASLSGVSGIDYGVAGGAGVWKRVTPAPCSLGTNPSKAPELIAIDRKLRRGKTMHGPPQSRCDKVEARPEWVHILNVRSIHANRYAELRYALGKQFGADEVLSRAMRAFWARGYEATSMQDIVDCTGIDRGRLDTTFGGNHGCFLTAAALLRAVLDDAMRRLDGFLICFERSFRITRNGAKRRRT